MTRKPTVFFAIPCGAFYSLQAKIIDDVSNAADISPIIVENHAQTEGLWKKIAQKLTSVDFFVADISSHSPDIALELGYALREKSIKNIGIFISSSAPVPVDLQGFVLQKYSSFADFQGKLIGWLCQSIYSLDKERFEGLQLPVADFHDEFKDFERFLRMWSLPPGASFILGHEGLRFSYAHLPILTTTLALLRDCEFEFRGRIVNQALGWVVKGTKNPGHFLPAFCVMFILDNDGILWPHIWNERHIHPKTQYQVFRKQRANIRINKTDGWFTLTTRVRGDTIEIEDGGSVVFTADLSKEPYAGFYDYPNKEGQIGFRCHPGEEAIINYVKV